MAVDWIILELRHRMEHLAQGMNVRGIRGWVNDHPLRIALLAALSTLVLLLLGWAFRPASPQEFNEGRQAWFFDQNTQKLFVASSKKTGPIAAPSGPLPDGNHAGLRARVYSYEVNPHDTELFVGFLERPDPHGPSKASAADVATFTKWAQARLIKRVNDDQWVPATSAEGQAIIQSLTHPNDRGQTPIYQALP